MPEAEHARGSHDEGGLNEWGGRGGQQATRPPYHLRLKRSVELFPAENGSLYLLRLGAPADDLMLAEPSAHDRVLLESLAEDFRSINDLRELLRSRDLPATGLHESLDQLDQAGLLEIRTYPRLLPSQLAERYDRQLIYFADLAPTGVDPDRLQLRLQHASVVILGCGGLGSWVAAGLAMAGVQRLTLIDDDKVELSNLNRQLLFSEDQLGQLKVEAAKASLLAHNHRLQVTPVVRRIKSVEDLDDLLAAAPDLVVCTADWPPHDLPRWINQAAVARGVPWIGAGQFPPRLRVGPLVVPGQSACLECLERAAEQEYPLYREIAAWRGRRRTVDPSLGPVSGVIGSLLAGEAMHWLLGAFRPSSFGAALMFDLQTMSVYHESVAADPDCTVCGDVRKCHQVPGRSPP